MTDLVILFGASLLMGGVLMVLNMRVTSDSSKFLSFVAMIAALACAGFTLVRMMLKVG